MSSLLFKTSTRSAHKAINAVVVVQTSTLVALSPFTTTISPVLAASIALAAAGLFFGVLRRYERKVVLSLELAGNGQTCRVELTNWFGKSVYRTIPVSAFLSTNATWPPGKKWWLAARYELPDNRGLEMLLFESFAGNVVNLSLFNRLLIGDLNTHTNKMVKGKT